MKFKDWLLKETGTSTSCIAGFSRMTLPMVTRTWPLEPVPLINEKKKKRKKSKDE